MSQIVGPMKSQEIKLEYEVGEIITKGPKLKFALY